MQPTSAMRQIREEHFALAAVLNSLQTLVESGPNREPASFFETVAAMLFYIDEFPERRHHPVESNVLFPMLVKAAPELHGVVRRLEMDHVAGEGRVRELQHQLLAWRFAGESRRAKFVETLGNYVRFYLQHMATEERELLPAIARLCEADQKALDAAVEAVRDPLVGGTTEDVYANLLTMITQQARNPVGLGLGDRTAAAKEVSCGAG
jgi:hemerythrin-like domain-containing protein